MSDAVLRRQLALLSGGEGKVKSSTCFFFFSLLLVDKIVAGFTRFQAYWRGHQARKQYKKLGLLRTLGITDCTSERCCLSKKSCQ